MSLLRNDIVRFWFWGYRGEIKTELQAPVVYLEVFEYLGEIK